MNRENPAERTALHHTQGTGIERIAYPIGIRTTTVAALEYVTPYMLRVTLEGPGLDGFHTYQFDDHVRVIFPDPDGTLRLPVPNEHLMLNWPHPPPRSRKYTVRRYAGRELDLDFVIHPGGLASTWAVQLQPGDEVAIAGPPGAKSFPQTYAHYLFAVDTTALPAAARWLEESSDDVSADLVIEHDHPEEPAYPLAKRADVTITWVPRGQLAPAVQQLRADPSTFLFAAGEADSIKPLRPWSKPRLPHLFTGYWKQGQTDHDE
ncbi:siderophore-interacting protein [Kribbella catacumbae]|uniref:siderophore-interacting protein n=1 Tax=Kribbella catacumbae TaxID=460086 RepID=UPI00058F17DB|nr:siderophore-interacting protein [Kribbella catacumbae]